MSENSIWYPRAEGEYKEGQIWGPPQNRNSDLAGKGIVATYWIAEKLAGLCSPGWCAFPRQAGEPHLVAR